MSVNAKPLALAQYAPNSASSIYTAPGGFTSIIDKFTATNTDASAHTLSVYLVPSGQSAGASYLIIDAQSIAAGATTDFSALQNQILGAGEQIFIAADTANLVVVRVSGRETQ